jgi:uncharacterized membrane protein YedE/YeeE
MPDQAIVNALLGGVLIGTGALAMLLWNGKIAGISGITKGLLRIDPGDWSWRLAFVAGLLAGGGVSYLINPSVFEIATDRSYAMLALAGLLVGFGTTMSNGCTSGHGVCGVSRLSPRSIAATLTFIGTGMITVFIYNQIAG